MNSKRFVTFSLILVFAITTVFAQKADSIPLKADTTKSGLKSSKVEKKVFKDSARLALEKMPRRAAIRSATLPGLGQITNGRWWKVPLVYGGFVGVGLVYEFNQRNYKIFLKEAQIREFNNTVPDSLKKQGNPFYAVYSSTGIISIKDAYRRNRDLSILGGIAFYALNIIDAYIDAKFFRFDVSDDLSIRAKPTLERNPVNARAAPLPGIKLTLSLN